MSSQDISRLLRASEALPDGPAVERRVDPPHLPAADPSLPPDAALTTAASAVLDLVKLRQHASQLAGHLDGVREDLDRRESELNSRLADAENQMRSARLWLRERDEEMATRMAALEHRHKAVMQDEQQLAAERSAVQRQLEDVASREAELETAQQVLERREIAGELAALELARKRAELLAEVNRRQQQTDARELAVQELSHKLQRSIEQRRAAIEEDHQRREAKLRLMALEAYQDEMERATAELAARHQELADAEALLADSQQQVRDEQEQLRQAWQRHEAQTASQREGITRRQREQEDEWRQRQESLETRSQQLESRQVALDQIRTDVATQHREALELRLASEELWIRISEAAPSAGLEQSLGRIRQRVAESYQVEHSAVTRQREEIEGLHAKLAEQYARLSAEKKELGVWIQKRQQDIESQAERLVAREQQLDAQEAEIERLRRAWEDERRAYQGEIRTLLARVRGERAAA